jgi:hypothetical protein
MKIRQDEERVHLKILIQDLESMKMTFLIFHLWISATTVPATKCLLRYLIFLAPPNVSIKT